VPCWANPGTDPRGSAQHGTSIGASPLWRSAALGQLAPLRCHPSGGPRRPPEPPGGALFQNFSNRALARPAAIPKLLDMLCLEGATVTIDAIGCQRKISQQITEREGDYVICLKGNQPELHSDVSLYLNDAIEREAKELDTCSTTDRGHGRVEHRKTRATTDVSWLQARHDWPGLKSTAAVEARVERNGETSVERRYFISSRVGEVAQVIGVLARQHWGVENNLHWMLDVAFGEDDCRVRIGNAGENLSRVRRRGAHAPEAGEELQARREEQTKEGRMGSRLPAHSPRDCLDAIALRTRPFALANLNQQRIMPGLWAGWTAS
jgi:predicted transposase YbfD/YdcC